jgi:hypothetical protein
MGQKVRKGRYASGNSGQVAKKAETNGPKSYNDFDLLRVTLIQEKEKEEQGQHFEVVRCNRADELHLRFEFHAGPYMNYWGFKPDIACNRR